MKRDCRRRVVWCLVLLGTIAALCFPGSAHALTLAGTKIPSVSLVRCELSGAPFKFGSNSVSVKVAQVNGVELSPPREGLVKPGKSISFAHKISNRGNIADSFSFEAKVPEGYLVSFLAADGVTPYTDSNADGAAESPVLAPGAELAFVVKVTAPAAAIPGRVIPVKVKATSTGDRKAAAAVVDLVTVQDPNFWNPVTQTVTPKGQVPKGTTLTYALTFGTSGNAAARNVTISDSLDSNLEYLEGSARLQPEIPGATTTYDKSTRTISWKIPNLPAGPPRSLSFQARVSLQTASDTTIENVLKVVSDEAPEGKKSNPVGTPVVEQPLRVSISAARTEVEHGDLVAYTVTVENIAKDNLVANRVAVSADLPMGFRYAKGSAALGGAVLPDPPAGALFWQIGSLEAGKQKSVTYHAVVSVDAPLGDASTSVVARGVTPAGNKLESPPASAKVKVVEGALSDKTIIMGRVFVDQNRDRMPDADEPGLRGVRLYLENGYFAITDGEGKFSMVDIDPGEHVLKLDRSTLPDGFEAVPLDSTFAGDGGSRFVSAPFGGTARGDFGVIQVKKKDAPKPEQQRAPPKEERTYFFGTEIKQGPQPLEQQILTMPDSAEILEPHDGAVAPNRSSDIVIRVPDGSDYTLRVNGTPLLQKQIGKTIVESQRKIRICQYVGVKLEPGENVIALEVSGADGQPGLKEIRVFAPGDAAKVVVLPDQSNLPADSKSVTPFTVTILDKWNRQVSGQIVYTVSTEKGEIVEPDLDPAKPGHQLMARDGKGVFQLRSRLRTGSERITVVAGTNLTASIDAFFTPKMRDWIVTGLGSLTLEKNNVSGDKGNLPGDDRYEEGLQSDGRIALFAKGTIFDDYLVTAAYDSDKKKREDLFQRVPPDRYYPIYGDGSLQGYEAESRQKYYLKVEKERSSLLVGDFNTDLSYNEFARYERPFNGVKADLDGRHATLRAFGASTDHSAVRDEIPGNGTSGYYFLRRREILQNSEKVRIEVRDRYHSERVISATDKIPYLDYSIDYRTGAILFREPVPSYDPNLNPVRIVVLYESEDAGSENHVYGGRGALQSDWGQIGVTGVVEENGSDSNTLYGIDGLLKVNDKTSLKVEAASSDTVEKGKGSAWKTELATRIEKAILSAYYRRVDPKFRNVSMTGNETGTEKYGASASYTLLEKSRLFAEGFVQSDLIASTRLTNTSFGVSQQVGGFTLDSGYRYLRGEEDTEGAAATVSSQMLFAGVSGKLNDRMDGSILQEQAFSSDTVRDYPSRTVLKFNYKINDKSSAFITEEFRESGADKGNNTLFGITTKLYQNVMVTTSYKESSGSNEGREVGTELSSKWEPGKDVTLTTRTGYQIQDTLTGERGQALLGVDTSWEVVKGLKLGAKAERVQVVSGSSDPNGINTAFALSATYLASEQMKGSGRYEYRDSPGEKSNLYSFGWAWKLTGSVSLLGKGDFWFSEKPTGKDHLLDSQVGAAYRPLGRNSLYLLGMLRLKDDKKGSSSPAQEVQSLIGSLELSERILPNLTLHGKYAGKESRDTVSGRQASAYTDLVVAGATYDLTSRWDVDLSAKMMNQYDSKVRSIGIVSQLAYLIHKNVKVAAGYNWAKLNDRDLSGEGYSSSGPFIQLKFKFDETTIADIYSTFTAKHPPPPAPPAASPPPPPEPPPPPPKPVAMALMTASLTEEPVQIVGSVEALKVLVNDHEAPLQTVDVKLVSGSADEDVIELKGNAAVKPVRFRIEGSAKERISSWTVTIAATGGEVVDVIRGRGAPATEIEWDLKACGASLKGGELYRYSFEATYSDGSRIASPVRVLGVNRTSSFALSLTGGAFPTGSATLTRKAMKILSDAAVVLRKYGEEKIVIEGHTDSIGSDEANMELSRKRSQAAADYLMKEEKIPAERVIVRWFGKSRPIASNAIAEGREMNRRVEIKGEFSDIKRVSVTEQHNRQPAVSVNGSVLATDASGRFATTLASRSEGVALEMTNCVGRSARTRVALPGLTVIEPAGAAARLPLPEAGASVPYTFTGKTAAGGKVSVDGKDLAVAGDGSFSFRTELAATETTHWLQVRNADGYSKQFRLTVSLAAEEGAGEKGAAEKAATEKAATEKAATEKAADNAADKARLASPLP